MIGLRRSAVIVAAGVSLLGVGCQTAERGGVSSSERGNAVGVRTQELDLLYFDGCPNSDAFRANVELMVRESGGAYTLRVIDLEELAGDDIRRGYGSPTLLFQGADVFGMAVPGAPALACRNYSGGVPSAGKIKRAVDGMGE